MVSKKYHLTWPSVRSCISITTFLKPSNFCKTLLLWVQFKKEIGSSSYWCPQAFDAMFLYNKLIEVLRIFCGSDDSDYSFTFQLSKKDSPEIVALDSCWSSSWTTWTTSWTTRFFFVQNGGETFLLQECFCCKSV